MARSLKVFTYVFKLVYRNFFWNGYFFIKRIPQYFGYRETTILRILHIYTLSLHVLIKYVGHTHIFMVSQESKLMG